MLSLEVRNSLVEVIPVSLCAEIFLKSAAAKEAAPRTSMEADMVAIFFMP